MGLVDQYGDPVPEPEKHRRAIGFTASTVRLREDEEFLYGITLPREYKPDPKRESHDPPIAKASPK